MIKPARYDISFIRGDTPSWKCQLTHISDSGTRTVVDLGKGQLINGQVRYNTESLEVLYKLPIEVIDAKNGIFKWRIDKNASESLLPPGSSLSDQAVYDIQLTMGTSVQTIINGSFSIVRDVTRV